MDFQSLNKSRNFKKFAFCLGLFIKMLPWDGGRFSAVVQHSIVPFVDYFVRSGFRNPYEFFSSLGAADIFPYPALMLYLVALPGILFGWLIPADAVYVQSFLYKIPLLLADIGILLILKSWLKGRGLKLLALYWLSPVLIYITYFYGQLDIIPIFLLFSGLFFLFRERYLVSACIMGLSFSAKTNIVLCYAYLLLYLITKIKPRQVVFFFAVALSTFLLANIAYIANTSFLSMVFQNAEQNKVFQLALPVGNYLFYFIPAGLLLLLVKSFSLRNFNRDIFIMFLGFSFSIILFFVAPMPGWYFWIIPFFVYFYVKEEPHYLWLFFGLQTFATLYFLLLGYPIVNPLFRNIVFTLMQTFLAVNSFLIYQRGLGSYTKHKITASPFLIGIGGNSGVGKTFLSQALSHIFYQRNTLVLRGDDHHKWQRNDENWSKFTHLDPKANDLHNEITTLKNLKKMKKILRRHYDHASGQFTTEEILRPKNIIIFEGLHPFYLKAQRILYDLKIFLCPETELEQHWKIVRDKKERGHSDEKIWSQIKKREEDREKFIMTQKQYADILINIVPRTQICTIGDENENIETFFVVEMHNSIFLDPLIQALQQVEDLHIVHEYVEADKQTTRIQGKIESKEIAILAEIFIPGLQEIGVGNAQWPADSFGVLVLLIVYYIFEEIDNEI